MHTRAESKEKYGICEIGDAGNFLPDSGQRPPCLCGRQLIGVYLLAGQEEIRIGTLFVRGGNGEFRAVVNCENIEGSGCNMEECCGLTLHETDSAWRAYTTIWEDAVAHAAEVELADVTAEKVREQEAEKEEATRKLAENVSGEVNSGSVGKEKLMRRQNLPGREKWRVRTHPRRQRRKKL